MQGNTLPEALEGFLEMMDNQRLSPGYELELDLSGVPADRRGEVKNSLAALDDYGVEIRYLETDPVKLVAKEEDAMRLENELLRLAMQPGIGTGNKIREIEAQLGGLAQRRYEAE